MPTGLFDWLSAVSVTLASGLVVHLLRLNTRFHLLEATHKVTEATVTKLESEQGTQRTDIALSKANITALNEKVDTISLKLNSISEKTELLPAINQAMTILQDEFRWLRDKRGGTNP